MGGIVGDKMIEVDVKFLEEYAQERLDEEKLFNIEITKVEIESWRVLYYLKFKGSVISLETRVEVSLGEGIHYEKDTGKLQFSGWRRLDCFLLEVSQQIIYHGSKLYALGKNLKILEDLDLDELQKKITKLNANIEELTSKILESSNT